MPRIVDSMVGDRLLHPFATIKGGRAFGAINA
jgi:hypothetical protein